MKKTILTAIATVFATTSAFATVWSEHHQQFGFGIQESIIDIQAKVNNGTYYNYPYIVGRSNNGLFEKKLKSGTAIPQFINGNRLLNALKSKKKILVASVGANVHICLPVFKELAVQNGVSCSDLMFHLEANQKDDEDFFSNINETLAEAEAKLNDAINKETANEITNEVVSELTAEISREVEESISPELQAKIDAIVAEFSEYFAVDEITAERLAGLDSETLAEAEAIAYEISRDWATDGETYREVNNRNAESFRSQVETAAEALIGTDVEVTITTRTNGSQYLTVSEQ